MKIEKYLTHCIHISYVKIYPQLDTNRHYTCKYHAKHVHMYHSDTRTYIDKQLYLQIHLRTDVHHLNYSYFVHQDCPHFCLLVLENFFFQESHLKEVVKLCQYVFGKLEQLQLTTSTASKGVSIISSKSGTTAATALAFADNI